LIGGETRETVPTPLYLRSGDIIVMTEPCRKAFHGKKMNNKNNILLY
jgi:alkylated DNA repair protein alkB family protein 1